MFGSRGNSKLSVAFDIGTSSVSAIVFSSHGHNDYKPSIHNLFRAPGILHMEVDAETLRRQAVKGVRSLIPSISKATNHAPEKIILGLSAPYYISSTKILRKERKNPTESIQPAELDDLLKEGVDAPLAIFTRVALTSLVNGYSVANAVGTCGKTLEIQVRFDATTESLRQDLEAPFQSMGLKSSIVFAAVPNAYYYALRDVADLATGVLLIDVGGEMTEISSITDGALRDVQAISEGTHTLMRRIAETLHISLNDADFLLKNFSEGKLEDRQKDSVARCIEAGMAGWQDSLSTLFENYAQQAPLPLHIVLCGGGARIAQYRDVLKTCLSGRQALSSASISVMNSEALKEQFEDFRYIEGPEDLGLACLALLSTREIL